jgi:hypothetical protein
MGRVSYSMDTWWKPFLLVSFVIFAIAGVGLVTITWTRQDGPSIVFAFLWLVAAVWAGYWWLFRVSYRLELEDGQLRWFAPLRHGELPLSDLVSVEPASLSRQQARLKVSAGSDLYVMIRPGLNEFVTEVHDRSAAVTIPRSGFEVPSMRSTRNGFHRDG